MLDTPPCSGGFYIEAGSNDAESYSDSLHFELNRGWKVTYMRSEVFEEVYCTD